MKNVDITVEGGILTIKANLSKQYGPSSSGKTIIVASTQGSVSIPGREDVKIGLNVYKKPSPTALFDLRASAAAAGSWVLPASGRSVRNTACGKRSNVLGGWQA